MKTRFPLPAEFFRPATAWRAEKTFGVLMAAAFGVLALSPLRHESGKVRLAPAVIGVVLGAIALFRPQWLVIPNRLWLKLGALLHRVTSPLSLFLIYFLAFVPMSLVLRLFRYDPLRLRTSTRGSYWIKRDGSTQISHDLRNQF